MRGKLNSKEDLQVDAVWLPPEEVDVLNMQELMIKGEKTMSSNRFVLTSSEYDLLCKIARKSGMDCWFKLDQDKSGGDFVRDAESGKRLSIRAGVKDLVDGLTIVDVEEFSCEETLTLVQFLGALI